MRLFRMTWRDPATGKTKRSPTWSVELRNIGGTTKRIAVGQNKTAAREIGRKLADLVDLQRARSPIHVELLDWVRALPADMRARFAAAGMLSGDATAAVAPLSKLLDDFKASIEGRERTKKHVDHILRMAREVLDGIGAKTLADLDAQAVDRYLRERREAGLSFKSSNHRLAATKQFATWCARNGLQPGDTLALVGPVNAAAAPKRLRRALSLDELRTLLQTTHESATTRWGLDGQARALLYRLVAETGLRANEVRSLRVASFAGLDTNSPTVTVSAADAKNRREATLPMRVDTARALAAFLGDRGALERAFPFTARWRAYLAIRRDLEAAGISYCDASQRYADFHSLRAVFVTRLVTSGASARLTQTLARHASPTTTLGVYAKLGASDERRAIEALPTLAPTTVEPQAAPAQGA